MRTQTTLPVTFLREVESATILLTVTLDPRTPVIVGVGQVVERPQPQQDVRSRPSPLALMVSSLQRALDDANAKVPWSLDELIAISSVGWQTADAARMVANELKISVATTRKTPTGGDVPQRLIHDCATRILNGSLTSVALVGSEAIYSASQARKQNVTLSWPTQDADVGEAPLTGDETVPFSDVEYNVGLAWPTEVYPLFENARRARLGWTLEEQRHRLGSLWANFASVAATNPHAWITTAPSPEVIATPSTSNRMIGYPYTKLLVANLPVDMGAAIVMMSASEAQNRGIPKNQWIFPHVGAQANDHWFISDRMALDHSPAMEEIWASLTRTGLEQESISSLDLYSCFPTVVQTAADVMGIDPFDVARVPTVTGGLTFCGGPGNNYVTHAISALVDRLRGDVDALGMVTGVGWYSTKHAWGLYGSGPPAQSFHCEDVQAHVDARPRCVTRQDDGEIKIESYVVSHRHDGAPKKLIVAGRFRDGARTWCRSEVHETMVQFESEEMINLTATCREGVLFL